jgi:mono/diheme cytochrome c family protein
MKGTHYLLMILFFLAACNNTPQQNTGQSTTVEAGQQINAAGEQLFKVKCMQCHLPARDFAAPALAGVEKRWKDKALLYAFVKNSQEVIAKDKYAADLFEKWKQAPMLPFPDLSNADIDAILEYCNQVAEGR